ncbi:MAG: nuclease A inhibitor family protein [Acidobacteria bacterium]|nr:nuclease A inhibitor family protein [Acidobacteriota bacterium]MCA1608025.1 nuclease A inhibitor family protein [Acidobacteriota bacterium]
MDEFASFFWNLKSKNKNENKTSGPIIDRLAFACRGLNYMSETDAPLFSFYDGPVKKITAARVREFADLPTKTPTESVDFADFFAKLEKVHDWHTEDQRARTRKFSELRELLETELTDLQVWRLGRVQIEIFITGIDSHGNLAGVKTKAVET